MQWRGQQMANTLIMVCPSCVDAPAQFLKTITLPPDPMPVMNARPENYDAAENDYRVTEIPELRVTEDDTLRVIDESADESPK